MITPAQLGEMVELGFAPRDLDEMTLAEIASWRRVMGLYREAIDKGRRNA
ncbi:MAG TPA: hypothetical protein VMA37_02070 [Acetobacteraceae bacterium]|nr:hypothetical protein [Acetobacteraceae bacterium]